MGPLFLEESAFKPLCKVGFSRVCRDPHCVHADQEDLGALAPRVCPCKPQTLSSMLSLPFKIYGSKEIDQLAKRLPCRHEGLKFR